MTGNNKIKCFLLLVLLTFMGCSLSAKESFERFPLTEKVTAFTLSTDEKFLITADKTHIKVWNNATKKVIVSFMAHEEDKSSTGGIYDLKLTDDNKYLYSLNSTGSIKKWNFKTMKLIAKGYVKNSEKMIIYKDKIFVKGNLEIYSFDLNLRKKEMVFELFFPNHLKVKDLYVLDRLLYIGSDSSMVIFSLKVNKALKEVNFNFNLSSASKIVLYEKSYALVGMIGGHIKVVSLSNFKKNKKFKAHKHYVQDIAISNNKKYFASSGEVGPIKIWDAKTYRVVKEFKEHKHIVDNLYFSKDDKYLYVLGDDLRRYVLDLK